MNNLADIIRVSYTQIREQQFLTVDVVFLCLRLEVPTERPVMAQTGAGKYT